MFELVEVFTPQATFEATRKSFDQASLLLPFQCAPILISWTTETDEHLGCIFCASTKTNQHVLIILPDLLDTEILAANVQNYKA